MKKTPWADSNGRYAEEVPMAPDEAPRFARRAAAILGHQDGLCAKLRDAHYEWDKFVYAAAKSTLWPGVFCGSPNMDWHATYYAGPWETTFPKYSNGADVPFHAMMHAHRGAVWHDWPWGAACPAWSRDSLADIASDCARWLEWERLPGRIRDGEPAAIRQAVALLKGRMAPTEYEQDILLRLVHLQGSEGSGT